MIYVIEDGEIVAKGSYKELLVGTTRFSSTLREFHNAKDAKDTELKENLEDMKKLQRKPSLLRRQSSLSEAVPDEEIGRAHV